VPDELFPILTTAHLDRSLGFYRDLLGGDVDYRFPPDGEPAFVSLKIGRSTLGLGRQDRPADLVNDRIALWVYDDDCDATVDRLRGGGVRVVQEPVDQPWGERMATVADPDGNHVIIATRGA
jgi:lactoylglutathione lyase